MNNNNWEIFPPQSTKGKYEKYATMLVIIVSVTYHTSGKKRDEIKAAKMYLTKAVDAALQHADFIKLGRRGNNVGLIPLEKDDLEAYVINRKMKDSKETGMPFINCNAFAKLLELRAGVYSAFNDGGTIIFDSKQVPSKP